MPRDLALRAIREVAMDMPDVLHVTFFGGEPTLCMDTVRASVDLARALAPNCLFHLSTGGIVPEKDIAYLVEQGFTINLSMDGPPEIQNVLRPFPDGKPSAEFVERTISQLVERGAAFKVRCTVTELNVSRLSECVEYWGELGVRYVHFEPINIVGRAARAEMTLPDADVYIENFLAALDTAEKLGVGLINSAYMNLLNPSPCYCTTVAGDKLMVAPDGTVTLCYEVQECGHPLSDFVIGQYDPETDEFIIDKNKQERLNSITVEAYEECKNCFAKYVCAGGCPNRNILATGSLTRVNPWICKVKKALIRDAVIRIYKASKEGKSVSPMAGDLNRSGISPII
jgi:radical SAM protein with 4Fe4S-binding SPASM domain